MPSAIGATAWSSVSRSSCTVRSDASRSKRGCSRNRAPAATAGEDVEQPEDVDRRRRDLEAVVVGEAERGDPVLHAVTHRAVGVTDRLREAGGARAEHEHRVGVDVVDLPDADATRQHRWVLERERRQLRCGFRERRPSLRRRPPRAAVSPRRTRARSRPPSRPGCTTRPPRPSCSAPYSANTNSGRFADRNTMRVPGCAPASDRISCHVSARACTSR